MSTLVPIVRAKNMIGCFKYEDLLNVAVVPEESGSLQLVVGLKTNGNEVMLFTTGNMSKEEVNAFWAGLVKAADVHNTRFSKHVPNIG
jgi:hypothetical protein